MPGSMSNTPALPCTTTALLCKNALSCVSTPSVTCLSMGLLPLVVCNRFPRAVRLHRALLGHSSSPRYVVKPPPVRCHGALALPHSARAPPRNPPRELVIAQPVADLVQ